MCDETWKRFENVDAFNNVSSSDPNDMQSWNNRLIHKLKSIPSVFKLHQMSAFGRAGWTSCRFSAIKCLSKMHPEPEVHSMQLNGFWYEIRNYYNCENPRRFVSPESRIIGFQNVEYSTAIDGTPPHIQFANQFIIAESVDGMCCSRLPEICGTISIHKSQCLMLII